MRTPGARGLLGATLAAATFGAVVLQPRAGGEAPSLPRVETWISAACGGDEPCERWESARRLSTILAVRMQELPEDDRLRLATAIAEEAAAAGLDPLFVLAVIEVESGFDHEAVSHRGAQGLMQLRPSTLRGEAERSRLVLGDPDEPVDPVVNVRLGIRYYRRLLDAFRQNHELALMAYNAGPQRISRLIRDEGGVPDRFRAYARRVNAEFRRLRGDRSRVALAPGAALDGAGR